MALQSNELFGSLVSQTPNLRAFPDQDGVRPGQLEQLGADADLAHLLPISQNDACTYRVWTKNTVTEVTTLTAASTTATDGTYTLTVDGETTGNLNHDDAAAVIQAELEALGVVDLGDVVVVEYNVSEADSPMLLNIALVEDGLVSKITRGENKGRTLRHDGVVRAFKVVPPEKTEQGRVTLKLPKGLVKKNAAIIAYTQSPTDRAVTSATRADLPVKTP